MIIQPKGRGWTAIVTDKTAREIAHLLNAPTNEDGTRDRQWTALRRKIAHGPAVSIRKAF